MSRNLTVSCFSQLAWVAPREGRVSRNFYARKGGDDGWRRAPRGACE